jgi:hypothetical protein
MLLIVPRTNTTMLLEDPTCQFRDPFSTAQTRSYAEPELAENISAALSADLWDSVKRTSSVRPEGEDQPRK